MADGAKRRLFRFTGVRPIKAQTRGRALLEFGGKPTEFLADLMKADSPEAAKALARRFRKDSPYFRADDLRGTDFWPLILGMHTLYASVGEAPPAAVKARVRDAVGEVATPAELQELLSRSREIWDHYFAVLFLAEVADTRRAALVDCLRAAALIPQIDTLNTTEALIGAAVAMPVAPVWIARLITGRFRTEFPFVAGIGDLMIVKDEWVGYERGEIAYVENVMATETKSFTDRRLDSTQTTTTTEQEATSETSKQVDTSLHNSLQTEVENTISTESRLSTGVTVSASYGPAVSVDTSASFDFGTASEESTSSAEEYAQDVVEQSLSKVTTRELTQTVTVVLSESEETYIHSFTNTAPDAKNLTGVYRYLNQVWRAQVYNYGRRLMLDFVVPEPSVNWRKSREVNTHEDGDLEVPRTLKVNASSIDAANYQSLAKEYGAATVPAPPDTLIHVSKVLQADIPKRGTADASSVAQATTQLSIPDGYAGTEATVQFASVTWNEDKDFAKILINGHESNLIGESATVPIGTSVGTLEVGLYLDQMQGGIATLRVKCEILPARWAEWQNAVYQVLAEANQRDWDAYEAARKSKETTAALQQQYFAAAAKRSIEAAELKRSAIAMISESNFEDSGAIEFLSSGRFADYPLIRFGAARKKGAEARFFEEAFEWDEMTYLYYPYYWARRAVWWELLSETDPDTLFEAFLRAGAARVNVAVRPGFEAAVLYYMATGDVWFGGPPPVIGDPLYVALIDEIVAGKGLSLDNPKPVGEPWTYTMPTSFVVLDPDDRLIPPPVEPARADAT
jgi:hypothetical protein